MIRGLVVRHDRVTREVEFNARLHAFAKHWGFRPRACAPYPGAHQGEGRAWRRAMSRRTPLLDGSSRAGRHWKPVSKDGRAEVADQRVHATTGEAAD